MELRGYIGLFKSKWWLLALAIIVCASAAFAVSTFLLQKQYTASASFEVNIPATSQSGINFNTPALVATEAQLPTSVPVAQKAIADVGLSRVLTARQLLMHTACVPSDIAQSFTCTLTYRDRILAQRLLDDLGRFAVALNDQNQARQWAPLITKVSSKISGLQADLKLAESDLAARPPGASLYATQARIDTDNSQLSNLQRQLLVLEQTSAAQSSSIIPLNPADAPLNPSSPRPVLNTALAAVLGLLLGVGALLAVFHLNDSPQSVEQAAEELGAPVLGSLPQTKRQRDVEHLEVLANPQSLTAEVYRLLHTNVRFANVDAPLHTLLVTSSVQGEGKTTAACNLAITLARFGAKVILVDADLRRPMINVRFGLTNAAGLTNVLLATGRSGVAASLQMTKVPNLSVLATGPIPPNPTEVLSSQRMHALLDELKTEADYVIIDSPPVLPVADALVVATMCDGVIFIVDTKQWKLRTLKQSHKALASVGVRITGVVLNRMTEGSSGYYRYSSE